MTKPYFTLRVLFLILVLLLSQGCIPRQDPRWKSIKDSEDLPQKTRQDTCATIRKRSLQLASIRGLYSVDLEVGSTINSFRISLAFKAPDLVRLEILPTTAAVALIMGVSSKDGGVIVDNIENRTIEFENSRELADKLLQIDLPAEDLAYILSARVPVRMLNRLCPLNPSDNDNSQIFFRPAPDGAGVTVVDFEMGNFWTINPGSGLLRTALLREEGSGWPILSVDYVEDDFSEPNHEMPRQQSVVIGSARAEAKISTNYSKFNSAIKPEVFKLRVAVNKPQSETGAKPTKTLKN
jgi:hypothetical protein